MFKPDRQKCTLRNIFYRDKKQTRILPAWKSLNIFGVRETEIYCTGMQIGSVTFDRTVNNHMCLLDEQINGGHLRHVSPLTLFI